MNKNKMKAMVLAAGLGTRMRPLTDNIPKPLVPVHGRTLIDHVLDWLSNSEINEVVVNSFYKAELLEEHLAKRQLLSPDKPLIQILREESLLEAGGGIKNALALMGREPFFSANSDTICIDGKVPALARLRKEWDYNEMDALLLVHPVDQAIGYEGNGDFFVGGDGSLRRRLGEAKAPFVFTGVQLLHPRFFENSPDGAFSMNLLYNRGMAENGTLSRVRALIHDGSWLHIGDPKGVAQADKWFSSNR